MNLTNVHSLLYKYNNGSNLSLIHAVDNSLYSTCTRQNKSDVAGLKSYSTAKVMNLFSSETAKGHWVCSADSMPVLTYFADEYAAGVLEMNTDWYDESASEYTLQDAGDLMGFAVLSQKNTFAGKTVKLGADIVLNEDMSDPKILWPGIGASSSKFEGTFDGQGHTISGIYQTGSSQLQGFFADVKGGTLKNFRLVNSSFAFTGTHAMAFVGSIAGRVNGGTGGAVLENIYADAAVFGKGRFVGGLVGSNDGGNITLTNCWNAGNVSGESTEIGGIFGTANGIVTMRNVLNTGNVTAVSGTYVGGLIGFCHANSLIDIAYALTVGTVSSAATSGTGTVIGSINLTKATLAEIYAIQAEGLGECNQTVDADGITSLAKSALTGEAAVTAAPALFEQKNASEQSYWSVSENGTPVLGTLLPQD